MALNSKRLVLLLGLLIALAVVVFAYNTYKRNTTISPVFIDTNATTTSTGGASASVTKAVKIGTTTIAVELAQEVTDLEKGLGGRASLDKNSGLLFVFGAPFEYGFWMKDMKFPIDIIFISADKKVVTVTSDISPDTYTKQNPPKAFYPDSPILYALEVNAGFAKAHGIRVGDSVSFK